MLRFNRTILPHKNNFIRLCAHAKSAILRKIRASDVIFLNISIARAVAARASNEAEKLLARRLCDLSERADRSGAISSTAFLSPSEQEFCRTIAHLLPCPPGFDGGFEGAERAVARFGEYGERPVAGILLTHKTPLGHRDILGSVLGLGLERGVVGDIVAGENESRLVVLRPNLAFLLGSFDRAGRVRVEARELPLERFEPPERRTERKVVSVASPRLDALVAAAWGLSRDEAQSRLTRGLVQLNHRPTLDHSKQVKEGDTVSLRGRGKLVVGATLGESRRGRQRIEIEKYV